MKRHFLAGFMAFCVGAMALTTVSCTKEIEQDIADLKEQVADLAKKIADLEAKLTNEVSTLNTAIGTAKTAAETADAKLKAELEAKIAVVNVEQKDGNVVLTLGDGSKITVATPDANANNTDLVTTVIENGVTYWAVVGADGKAKSLGVEVGHPDVKLSFKVNAETNELLVSYDGVEYEGTGVLVKDPDAYNHVVTAFEDGEDYVKLTIGEVVYTLPKYVEDNASLGLSRQEMFVGFGTSKDIELKAEGIAEYYVMAKPDGWKASIEGSVLTISAPSKKVAELGACESEGDILIHATTDNGKCKVAKIAVTSGLRFYITIDSKAKNVTFFNAISYLEPDYTGMGFETYSFGDAEIGVVEKDVFESYESFEAFIKAYTNYEIECSTGFLSNIKNNNDIFSTYIPNEVEEETFEMSMEKLCNSFYPRQELVKGVHYVVFAIPQSDKQHIDEAVYAYYEPIEVSLTESSVSFNDIIVNLECSGADGYYVGSIAKSMLDPMGMTLKDFMELGYTGWGGPWKMFQQNGDYEAIGKPYKNGSEISLAELNYGDLTPGSEYYVWAFPAKFDTPASEYVYEEDFEPYVYTFKTTSLAAGGAEPTIERVSADYETLEYNVVPGENAVNTYYHFYDTEEISDMTDEELVNDVISNCYFPLTEEGTVTDRYLTAGTKRTLVVVSVDAEAKYGLAVDSWETPNYPYDANIVVNLESLVKTDNVYTAKFKVTGADKLCIYYTYYSAYDRFAKYLLQYGAQATNVTFIWADVVDGEATVTFEEKTSAWNSYDYLHFSGYNVADGAVTSLSEYKTVEINDYITVTE